MSKNDDDLSIFTKIISVIAFILSMIGLYTIISTFSAKPSDTDKGLYIAKDDAILDVCGEIFEFKDYTDKYGFYSLKMSEDINKTCEEYITDNLREQIEEEYKNE